MNNNTIDPNFKALIQNEANWPKFQELMNASSRIVGEFDEGMDGVLCCNEDGVYDRTTNIEQLRGSLLSIDPEIVPVGNHYPHLTDKQMLKIYELAIEITMAGDGTETMTREDAIRRIDGADIREMIENWIAFDDNEKLTERLGFNPETGV